MYAVVLDMYVGMCMFFVFVRLVVFALAADSDHPGGKSLVGEIASCAARLDANSATALCGGIFICFVLALSRFGLWE